MLDIALDYFQTIRLLLRQGRKRYWAGLDFQKSIIEIRTWWYKHRKGRKHSSMSGQAWASQSFTHCLPTIKEHKPNTDQTG